MSTRLSDRPYRIQSWDSARELSGFLSRCDAGSVFLGQELARPARLFSITLYLDDPIRERFGIGVATTGETGVPHLLVRRDLGLALVAADREVRGVDVETAAVSVHLKLDSPFSQFIETGEAGVILVFYRTGVIAIADGWELWRHVTGRILDWASEQGTLFLRLEGAPTLKLDIRTGAELV
ncbi:MAG: hypothetical protein K0Q72_2381 [Armatimonadetes bacterium]|jgi:hypothetical protein|nr:hypothetical protein [Armatimonadota bacterium]